MPVDIGQEAEIRGGNWSSTSYTLVVTENPASAGGIITDVDIYALTSLEGCVVGTFFTTNGATLKCRAFVNIGDVSSGAKRTFSALSLAVEIGDYIGMYFTAGALYRDFSGYDGFWYASGQYIDVDDETSYTVANNNTLSLGGYIGVAGWTHKFLGVANASIGKINGIAIADILKVNSVE